MKVAVIGLGSMGKRRIRLLKGIRKDIQIYGIDMNIKRAEEAQREFGLDGIDVDLKQITEQNQIEAVLVCSSPLTHSDYILKALEREINTFSEINLTDEKYDEIIKRSSASKRVAFLSSTFLYRNEIKWIKEHTKPENTFYRYHIGQYLPDWHPWESYKDFFVKDQRTNGCREIMAIEFPWILDVFGEVFSVKVIKSKKTKLELDYPDVYHILFEHLSGALGNITIDLVSRKPERALQIISEDKQVEWGGTPETLYEYDIENKEMRKVTLYKYIVREKGYAANIIENAYEEELRTFLSSVEQKKDLGLYNYEKDKCI